MGGLLILVAIVIPTLLWADLRNTFVWIALGATLCYGAIGLADDYLKLSRKRSAGLTARTKLVLQVAVAVAVGIVLVGLSNREVYSTELLFPFFKDVRPDLSWFFVPFAVLVMVGASNAVNLTDGLDGLPVGSVLIAAAAFTVLIYVTGHAQFSAYLDLIHIPRDLGAHHLRRRHRGGQPRLPVVQLLSRSSLHGRCGFARTGRGDWYDRSADQTGIATDLGGRLFVVEALSVIIQVTSFKLTGKRVFLMAPLHHHFELKGWEEPKIIIRFWIVAVIFALASLTTLKLR